MKYSSDVSKYINMFAFLFPLGSFIFAAIAIQKPLEYAVLSIPFREFHIFYSHASILPIVYIFLFPLGSFVATMVEASVRPEIVEMF